MDKTDFPNLYKVYTRIADAKTDSPNSSKPTHFAVIKTDSPNFYNFPTRFAAVKRDSPNFYIQASYRLSGGQNGLATCTDLLHALQVPKRTLRTCTSLLQVLQWSKRSPRTTIYRPPISIAVVKTDSPHFCKPPIRAFAVDKGDSPKLYKVYTRFAEVKTN